LQEYLDGTDPTDFFNGLLIGLQVTGGGDQRRAPGTLLPVPLSIRAGDIYSYGVPNAPVTFVVEQGSARLTAADTGVGVPSTELTVRPNAHDDDGYMVAQVYVLLPPNPGVSVIRASTKGGSQSFSVATTAVAIDRLSPRPAIWS
jgi:hypothetical protein